MKKYLLPVLLNLLMVSVVSAENATVRLSLKEAVRLALEQNLDLKAELYNAAQAEADIRRNRAIYETRLTLDTSYADAELYSPGQGKDYSQSTFIVSPGLKQLLSTGGTLGLSYENTKHTNSTVAAPALGSYWSSSLGLTLNQPLLRNFGRDTTELNIRVSVVSKEISLSRLRSRILDLVSQVRTEYYRLSSYREDLESRRASLELAKKVQSDTEARIRAGVLPAMELLNAEFGVSSRQKELIDAEKAVSDQVDTLSQLLRLVNAGDIITTDRSDRGQIAINEEESLRKALSLRAELEELLGQVKSAELQAAGAKNQTSPTLNFVGSAGFAGIDRNNGRNNERLTSLDYPAWSVGLQLDYPLGNQAAENDYIKSRLKVDQSRTQVESLKSSITSEVRLAIRGVHSSYKQLDVADRARRYADERVKAYLKKSDVGLATTKDLLDVENDLATARANQIKAEVQYSIALNQYWKATGELLEREGIRIDASRSDELYRGVR